MSAYLALNPVSAAIVTVLNASSALLALAPGGVHDQVREGASYPCIVLDVREAEELGGFGSRDGRGHFPRVELRVTVYSKYRGFAEAHGVMAKVHELLATPPTVSGYSSWYIVRRETVPIEDSIVAGQRVNELVSNYDLFVEAA